jgi:SAM-dependent methyltransferase
MKKIILNYISPIIFVNKILDKHTKNILNECIDQNENWLDVGCGTKPYETIFLKNGAKYTGIDVDVSGRDATLKMPHLIFDGINIPYPDNYFEGVICTQVLEHVIDEKKIIQEIFRVLKPKGKIVISVPFCYSEHEKPYDFRRFTSFGLKHSFEKAGFVNLVLYKELSAIQTLATLFSVYVSNNLTIPIPILGTLVSTIIFMPINLLAFFLSYVLPDKKDLFMGLIITGNKK